MAAHSAAEAHGIAPSFSSCVHRPESRFGAVKTMAEMVAEEAEQEMIARWLEEAPVVLDAIARDEDHRGLTESPEWLAVRTTLLRMAGRFEEEDEDEVDETAEVVPTLVRKGSQELDAVSAMSCSRRSVRACGRS